MSRVIATFIMVLHLGSASRVLITPVTTTKTPAIPREAQDPVSSEEPCTNILDEDLPELDACSCYSWLPSPCTRLLRRGRVEMKDCGARVGNLIIPPDSCQGGYYGYDDSLDPSIVLEEGLRARGSDWDLIRHAEQSGDSAFRGTTKLVSGAWTYLADNSSSHLSYPDFRCRLRSFTQQVTYPDGGGAAAWADEGGYVYEITCVPSWDVNKHLQGRRMVSDLAVGAARFGGNLAIGEHEHAIPAHVPPEHIKRYGSVVASTSGVPFVPRNAWVTNPRWDPCFCRYSLSECDSIPCH